MYGLLPREINGSQLIEPSSCPVYRMFNLSRYDVGT